MSYNKIAAVVALVLTVVWLGIFAFVNFFGDPSSPTILSSGTLTLIIIATVPVILIWLASASVATSVDTDNRLWKLESEIRNIRAQLASSSKLQDQSGQPEMFGDPVGDRQPGTDAEQTGEDHLADADRNEIAIDDDDSTDDSHANSETDGETVSNPILIRALNFAEDEHDVMGIAAVDTAAQIPEVSDLLASSMRILEIFADAGVVVDQLGTQLAAPDRWREANLSGKDRPTIGISQILDRQFVAAVRGIDDRNPEFSGASRDFRDRAAAFLEEFVKDADDNEITGILNTRTYLSFILLEHAHA